MQNVVLETHISLGKTILKNLLTVFILDSLNQSEIQQRKAD